MRLMGFTRIILVLLAVFCNLCQSEANKPRGCSNNISPFPLRDSTLCYHEQDSGILLDKANRCPINRVQSDFIENYNLTGGKKYYVSWKYQLYWSDNIRDYDGGPLIISQHSVVLFDEVWKPEGTIKENPMNAPDMCAVVNIAPVRSHSVGCKKNIHGICIISPLLQKMDNFKICPSQSTLFISPVIACLKRMTIEQETANVGITSSEAADICRNDSGYLLQQGYIYSKYFDFDNGGISFPEYPVGIKGGKDGGQWRFLPYTPYNKVPQLNLSNTHELSSISYQRTEFNVWEKERRFKNLICEYSPKLPYIKIRLYIEKEVDPDNLAGQYKEKLILEVEGDFDLKNTMITCLTDSGTHYQTTARINYIPRVSSQKNTLSKYVVEGKDNGYYRCIMLNKIFDYESNKILLRPNRNSANDVKVYLLKFPEYERNKTIISEIIKTDFPSVTYKIEYQNNSILIHSKPPISTTHQGYIVIYERNLYDCEELPNDLKNDPALSYCMCKGEINFGFFWECDQTVLFDENNIKNTFHDMLRQPVVPNTLETAVKQMNIMLQNNARLAQTVVQSFGEILNAVEIPQDKTYIKVVQSNIAVLAANRMGPAAIVGIKVKRIGDEGISENTMEPLTEGDVFNPDLYESNSDVIVVIPSNICHGVSDQLSFGVYKDDKAFSKEPNSDSQVNSLVISISLDNKTCFKEMDVEVYFRVFDVDETTKTKACAYRNNNDAAWLTHNCIVLSPDKFRPMDVICKCNNLTNFGQILRYDNHTKANYHNVVLFYITNVNLTFSLLGIIVIFFTCLISQLRVNDFSTILCLNLFICIALRMMALRVISFIDFDKINPLVCKSTGIILHYSILCSCSWMFLSEAGFSSYNKTCPSVIKRLDNKLVKILLILLVWIFPAAPIFVLLLIDSDSYLLHFKEGNVEFCYPTTLEYLSTLFTVLIPIVSIILLSKLIFTRSACRCFQLSYFTYGSFTKVCISFSMLIIYGVICITGLSSNITIFLLYIFYIVAMGEGLILFSFIIIPNMDVRKRCQEYYMRVKHKEKPIVEMPLNLTSQYKVAL